MSADRPERGASAPAEWWRRVAGTRGAVLALFAAYLALVALYWASGSALEAWDDAHFFKRIGLHILEHGSASWNLDEGPVYGNTSQLFQLVTLLPLLISSAYFSSLIKIVLALAALALFALLLRTIRTQRSGRDLACGIAFLMASSPLLLLLMHSGMETILASLVLCLNLHSVARNDDTPKRIAAVVLTTVAVYLMRPDAVLISIVVVASHSLLEKRRVPWRLASYCALALALTLLALYLYFGTAFPLSFHLKSRALTTYSEHFANLDLRGKRKNMISLVIMAAPLLYVAGHGKSWWRVSLVASFVAFTSYHYLSTVEIMSYRARFYLPGLVPLAIAAMVSAKSFRAHSLWPTTLLFCGAYLWLIDFFYSERMIWVAKEGLMARVPRALYLGYGVGASVLLLVGKYRPRLASLLLAAISLVAAYRGLSYPKQLRMHSDAELVEKQIRRYTTVRGIDTVRACLAEPLHIYHSEIGIPGVVFAKSKVTDLAGLMNRQIAFDGMDFDRRCQADQPEIIFLPHRNYKMLRSQILKSPCLGNYTRVVKDSSSPLYLRSDLLATFLSCGRGVKESWIDPALVRAHTP